MSERLSELAEEWAKVERELPQGFGSVGFDMGFAWYVPFKNGNIEACEYILKQARRITRTADKGWQERIVSETWKTLNGAAVESTTGAEKA